MDQLYWDGTQYITDLSATINGHVQRIDDAEASTFYTTLTPPRAAPPGALYFNTTDAALKFYDGSAWQAIGGGSGPSVPVPLATLGTKPAGSTAFITDSDRDAYGNFGWPASSGGSNVVPVWSNGGSWFIG